MTRVGVQNNSGYSSGKQWLGATQPDFACWGKSPSPEDHPCVEGWLRIL